MPSAYKYIAFSVVLILAFIFLLRSCNLNNEIFELKGKHEALQVAYAALDLKSRDLIAAYEQDIAAKDKAILEKNAEIIRIRENIQTKDADIQRLEAEYVNLGENKDAKIVNLQAQVVAWKNKFSLAEEIIAQKDGIIFDLTGKYESQVKISAEWKASYERQVELHNLCLERIGVMEKEWKGVRMASTVKNYVIAAVGAGLVYSLVKE